MTRVISQGLIKAFRRCLGLLAVAYEKLLERDEWQDSTLTGQLQCDCAAEAG